MKTSNNGIELIKELEGLRLKAYNCVAGKCTIGYGHTGKDITQQSVITEEEAEKLLKEDIIKIEKDLKKIIKVELKQNEWDAVVSFCYNVGTEAFRLSTMCRLINDKKKGLASEQFGKWVYAANKIQKGLINRREREAKLFLGNNYS